MHSSLKDYLSAYLANLRYVTAKRIPRALVVSARRLNATQASMSCVTLGHTRTSMINWMNAVNDETNKSSVVVSVAPDLIFSNPTGAGFRIADPAGAGAECS